MDEDTPTRPASIGAQRVRDYRARRRAAGLVEVKVWLREQDVPHAHAALRPFTNEADQALNQHQRQGRTNLVVIELQFPTVPPGQFREQLRQAWGLTWDQGTRRWGGKVEDQSWLDHLREFVAAHGGIIEVPTRG